jgi:segregation and condensation protein B
LARQLARVGGRSGLGFASPLDIEFRSANPSSWRRRLALRVQLPVGTFDDFTRDDRTARLEAVLFLAREPLTSRKLAQLAGLADGTEARTLVRRLNRWYDESGSAFRAEELAGGFQLLSRPKFGSWLRRVYNSPVETRLSSPALETLAVVAYRQPVLRAEIEAIRGVDCGEILRQLMDRDLVRTAGRAEELGRPYWYATTKRFLQIFGLRHIDDLPRAELLRTSALKATKSKPKPAIQPRSNGVLENLPPSECEDEEDFERDHHRPA